MQLDKRPGGRLTPTRRDLLQLAGLLGVTLVAPGAHAALHPVLTRSDRALIGEVAELIIPTTDTGGAREAGVPAFIEMMVEQWFDSAERDNFLAGMRAFANGAIAKYGKPFERLTPTQQTEYFGGLLAAAESKPQVPPTLGASSVNADAQPRSPFAALMKRLTLAGYYTSELGATVELSFTVVPEEHVACAPSKPSDRADAFAGFFFFPPFSAY